MKTRTDKAQEKKSQSIANDASTKRSSSKASFQFIDNRATAIAQRKRQEMADNSSQVAQLKAIQEMANNSAKAKQVAQLQQSQKVKQLMSFEKVGSIPSIGSQVIQRNISIGGGEKKSLSYWAAILARDYNWNYEDTVEALRFFDGQDFDTEQDLIDWVEVEVERIGKDKRAERNYQRNIGGGRVHTFERHTDRGIWEAGRVLTAHRRFVAIFYNGAAFERALANMPTLKTAWVAHPDDRDRYDAEIRGVHYQAQYSEGVMHLRSCYSLDRRDEFSKKEVKVLLEWGLSYEDFVDALDRLARRDRDLLRDIANHKSGFEEWTAKRKGDSASGGKPKGTTGK